LKVVLNTINLNHDSSSLREKFEDTKDVIRSRVEEGRTIQWTDNTMDGQCNERTIQWTDNAMDGQCNGRTIQWPKERDEKTNNV
jgi:hypothetical protein